MVEVRLSTADFCLLFGTFVLSLWVSRINTEQLHDPTTMLAVSVSLEAVRILKLSLRQTSYTSQNGKVRI